MTGRRHLLTLAGMVGVLLLSVPIMPAPETSPAVKERQVVRIFRLQYADVREVARVLSVFGVVVTSRSLGVIAFRGRADTVAAAEAAIRQLDVPPKPARNVEVVVYLLIASKRSGWGAVPPELRKVTRELQQLFGFQGFYLLDRVIVSSRDGEGGMVMGTAFRGKHAEKGRLPYTLQFKRVRVLSNAEAPVVRLEGLKLAVKGAFQPSLLIQTSIDVRKDQKVVIGKTGIGDPERALIGVVTARVLD